MKIERVLQLARKNLNALVSGEKFKRCFSDTAETYKDEYKQEKKTETDYCHICGFCDFKKCWLALSCIKVGSTAKYPKTVWYSNLQNIIHMLDIIVLFIWFY